MIGFIKKDLLMMKKNMKLSILFLLIFLIVTIREEYAFIFVPAFLSTMIFMSTFSYDEYNNWYAYAIGLPNGRKNLVKAKYIANVLILIIVVIIFSVLASLLQIQNHNLNLLQISNLACDCIASLSIIQFIFYPFIFKFGIEKGRIGIFIGVFGLAGLVSLLKDKVKIPISVEMMSVLEQNGLLLLIITMIIILVVSYTISIKIISRKEF